MSAVLGLPDDVRACLFDLDGVLTRTASVHQAAWKRTFDAVLRERDGDGFAAFTDDDYLAHVDGKPRKDGVRDFLTSRGVSLPEGEDDDPADAATIAGVGNRKNADFLAELADHGVGIFDDALDYLRAARNAGLRIAVVTASANGGHVISTAGFADLVEVRVDGVVTRARGLAGKPEPDTYLEAARELGVTAAQAAVFEDAQSGVAAGRAGAFGLVVGVDRVGQADALRAAGADVVVSDLSQLVDGA